MNEAILFDIQRNSFVDGPGIRTTVFFKGCNLRCSWCHNPESWDPGPQTLFYRHKCTGCGSCRYGPCPNGAKVLCGKTYTLDEVFAQLIKDKRFYDASGGGITCSGGECMLQPDFLEGLLKMCKQAGISTAVDTAGHVPYATFERIAPYTDLFLYDVKLMDPMAHKQHTGADNRLILDNLKKLLKAGARVWIRIPLIPQVNDQAEMSARLQAFLSDCPQPEAIEFLPYHGMGREKRQALEDR